MNTNISFEQNGDMIATPETGGAVYIGTVDMDGILRLVPGSYEIITDPSEYDGDGDLRMVPGNYEISEADVIEAILATMNESPENSDAWNADFTKAACRAGEKDRIPEAYLRQAGIEVEV